MDNYIVDPETGCWLWQGYRGRADYPYHLVGDQYVSARRWHYEQEHGPVPDGRKLLPACGHGACVCPSHVEPAEPRDVMRGLPSAKLELAQVREIRALAGQIPQQEIADQFGVSLSLVNQIIRGKLWIDEEAEPVPPMYERHYGKLTYSDAERIRDLAQSMPKKDVAAMYGVSASTISLIVGGKRWVKPQEASPSQPKGADNAQVET